MIGGGAQKITVEIGGKIAASLGSALRGAQTQVSSFGRNVSRTMNDAATAGKKGFKNIFSNDLWQGAAAGATAIGVGMAASVRVAATFEGVLTEIGKTANASQGELKTLSGEILKLSGRNITNLGPEKLAQGIQDLVAQGLELKDATASIETLGKVATATGSDLLDVTKTGFQLQNALKIRPTELKATFDALAFAGKQGAFELKDMAQFMPTIAAAAGSLGIQGREGAVSLAAMMQMVRKDAPDAGQAATRLTDAMLKMTAPQAVKNFAKFGVNIEQVLKDAQAKGINPMEAALGELQRVTGGDAFKLGEIFGDKEAKLALMSLMKYRKEYAKLRDDAGGQAAAGTVDKDFERSTKTFAGTLTSFQNAGQRLGISVGQVLLPPLTRLAEAITPMIEGFARFSQEHPGITTGIVLIGGALAGLVIALPFIASVVTAIGTIKTALIALKIGATIAGFAGVIGPAMGAIVTAITGPIGIAVLAIIGIGLAFKAAYDKIPAFRNAVNATMTKVGQIFQASWTAIKGAFQGFITYVGGAWKVLTGILTLNPARIGEGFQQAFGGIKQMASSWLGWMDALWPGVKDGAVAAFQGVASVASGAMNGLGRIVTGAIDGIKAGWSGLVSIAQQAWAAIMAGGLGQYIEGIKNQFAGLGTFFQGAWNTIVGIFTLDAGKAVAGVQQAFSGMDQIGAGILQAATGMGRLIVTGVVAGVRGIGAAIQGLGGLILQGLQALGTAIVAGVSAIPGLVSSALGALAGVATSIFARIVQAARDYVQVLVSVWRALPGRIIAGLQSLIGGVRSVFNRVVAFIKETPGKVASVGTAVIDAILNGLKARAGALFGWIGGTWDRIKSMVGSGEDAPADAPAAAPARSNAPRSARPGRRALGGPVSAGMPYIVGEKRRELFVPGMDGAIIPRIAQPITAGAIAAMLTAQPAMAAPAALAPIFAPQITALAGAPPVSVAAPAAPAPLFAPQITGPDAPAPLFAPRLTPPAAPPVSVQAPVPPQAQTVAPVTIHAPITIHAGAGADAMEIRRQIELAFNDIQREIESSHRVLLND